MTPMQPRFAPFATMLVAVLAIYLLLSQIGKRPLPLLDAAPAAPVSAAPAADPAQEALRSRRERALVAIGARPRTEDTAAPAPRTANGPAIAVSAPAPAAAPAPRRLNTAPVTARPVLAAATAAPVAAPAVPAAAPARYYQVRGGDTLFSIARKTYGDGSGWKRILEANNLASPSALTVGRKLVIPPAEAVHTASLR